MALATSVDLDHTVSLGESGQCTISYSTWCFNSKAFFLNDFSDGSGYKILMQLPLQIIVPKATNYEGHSESTYHSGFFASTCMSYLGKND